MHIAGTEWVISVHFGENQGAFERTCAFSKRMYRIGNKPAKRIPSANPVEPGERPIEDRSLSFHPKNYGYAGTRSRSDDMIMGGVRNLIETCGSPFANITPNYASLMRPADFGQRFFLCAHTRRH